MIVTYVFLGIAGVAAGCISGIVGTGASLMLLPLLIPVFGVVEAMPIMAIAGLMANFARVLTWCRNIDWRATLSYGLPGMPSAYFAATLLVSLPKGLAEILLGCFILSLVPARRFIPRDRKLGLPHLALAGIFIGFLTGMFLSTGPLSVPVFLSYGLAGGAFIATEAAASLIVQMAKLTSFRELGLLPASVLIGGLAMGVSLMLGTALSRPFVLKLSERQFRLMMDGTTVVAALLLLQQGVREILSV